MSASACGAVTSRVGKKFAALALSIACTVSPVSAGKSAISNFVDAYRCEVLARLISIHLDRTSADVRYLTISITKRVEKTVTCVFIENDTKMMCETASTADAETAAIRKSVTIAKKGAEALGWLGFWPNEEVGNFQQFVAVKKPQDLRTIAELMLAALYVGYGVRSPNIGISLVGPAALQDGERIAACRQEQQGAPLPRTEI